MQNKSFFFLLLITFLTFSNAQMRATLALENDLANCNVNGKDENFTCVLWLGFQNLYDISQTATDLYTLELKETVQDSIDAESLGLLPNLMVQEYNSSEPLNKLLDKYTLVGKDEFTGQEWLELTTQPGYWTSYRCYEFRIDSRCRPVVSGPSQPRGGPGTGGTCMPEEGRTCLTKEELESTISNVFNIQKLYDINFEGE